MSTIGGFMTSASRSMARSPPLSSRPKGARFVPETGRTGGNPPSPLISAGRVEIVRRLTAKDRQRS